MQFAAVLFSLFILGVSPAPATLPDDCGQLKVTYSSQAGSEEGKLKIELTAKGGSEPYFYFFFDKKNNPINWDFNLNYCTVEKDKFPKYAKVLDSKGCTKTIAFNESTDRQ